jgi:hypothetical protein
MSILAEEIFNRNLTASLPAGRQENRLSLFGSFLDKQKRTFIQTKKRAMLFSWKFFLPFLLLVQKERAKKSTIRPIAPRGRTVLAQ